MRRSLELRSVCQKTCRGKDFPSHDAGGIPEVRLDHDRRPGRFALYVLLFHVLLGGRVTGIGLLGLGAAVAGIVELVRVERERRQALRRLAEEARECRIARRMDRLEGKP